MDRVLLTETISFEDKLFPLFEQAGVGFAKVGLDCKWLRVNQKLCEMTGYTEAELLNMTFCDMTHPEDLEADLINMQAVMAGQLPVNDMKKRYIHKDGCTVVWIHLTATLVRDDQGQPDYFITIIEDITKKKLIEKSLFESEERYRLVLQGSNDGIWDWDLKNNQVYWSDRFREIAGAPANANDHDLGWRLIHPDDRKLVSNAVKAHLEQGTKYELEFRFQRPSGEIRYVLARAQAVRDGLGEPIRMAGVITDITDRVLAESVLKESEERFRSMADSSPVMIYVSDHEKATYVNKTSLEFFGLDLSQWYSSQWQHYIHPDDLKTFVQHCQEAATRQAVFETEVRALRHDQEYRWLMVTGAPRLLPNSKLAGYVGVAIDITETKLAQEDLKTYALKLEKSNKELEQFATIASHDLQAPLRKVRIFSDTLKANAGDALPAQCYDSIERIQKAAAKMQNLITDLLILSRINRKGQPFYKTSLASAAQEAIHALELNIAESQGKVEIGPMVELEADPNQMRQLLQNLIENALKFHKPGEPPVIIVTSQILKNGFCEITVSDNGIGFEERFLDRIFLVFERLHSDAQYSGTGIGLAICHKIAERHNGTITAKSAPGQGARFVVTLPVRQSGA